MSRLTGLILAKGIELLLIVTLHSEYGGAETVEQLWAMFLAQSELARIGTLTAATIVLGILGATLLAAGKRIRDFWKKIVDFLFRNRPRK